MAEATSELFLKCDALQMTNQRLVRVSNKAVSSASVRLLGGDPTEKRSFLAKIST